MSELFVHALYDDELSAQRAVEALVDAHFPADEVSVLMRGEHGTRDVPVVQEIRGPRGALIGAVLGATLGATGFGGFLAIGPLLTALQATTAGALFGGFAGTVGGLGFWETEADFPKKHLERGGVLVGVSTYAAREAAARAALEKTGGHRLASSERSPQGEANEELDPR